MKGNRFEGMNEEQWLILKPLLPQEPKKKKKGKPHTPWRKVCNSLLWMLINGARWCDLPKGKEWASRSATHRWLGIWEEAGILMDILTSLREQAEFKGILNVPRLL